MNLEMVPALVEAGHGAIVVMLDVWGIANFTKSSIEKARGLIPT
jgi:4-hydroxy-2-oxoheptanedioate aldolase